MDLMKLKKKGKGKKSSIKSLVYKSDRCKHKTMRFCFCMVVDTPSTTNISIWIFSRLFKFKLGASASRFCPSRRLRVEIKVQRVEVSSVDSGFFCAETSCVILVIINSNNIKKIIRRRNFYHNKYNKKIYYYIIIILMTADDKYYLLRFRLIIHHHINNNNTLTTTTITHYKNKKADMSITRRRHGM